MGADPDLECISNRKDAKKYSARSLCELKIEEYKKDIEGGLGDIKMSENILHSYEDFFKIYRHRVACKKNE